MSLDERLSPGHSNRTVERYSSYYNLIYMPCLSLYLTIPLLPSPHPTLYRSQSEDVTREDQSDRTSTTLA